ncbi:MAG: hypothetical protein LUC16_02190 [Coprobacillus sp.]|nr:hypothetical protein [Coprobacillus sp.]
MKVIYTQGDERHTFSGVHTISESQAGMFELYISAGGTHSTLCKKKTKRETFQRITTMEIPRVESITVILEPEE